MLIVIVGPRGAGKSTLQDTLRDHGVRVLQPSTTRQPRKSGDQEYNFVDAWDEQAHAWKINVGDHTYGMRWSELEDAASNPCVTVFDPMSLQVFQDIRKSFAFETMTVGLNTIANIEELSNRVGGDKKRLMDERSLIKANEVVSKCDIVLRGDADTVANAMLAMLDLLKGRGGIVTKRHLQKLISAGALLNDTEAANIRSASYDLRVGHEILCQGKIIELTETSPYFELPPYSYAIVSALEHANLPPFLIGRFDLKVSFFFEGIILSNGPQIDPGYKGALFCMLYNGSGRSKLLMLGRQFASIDFTTTTAVTKGYAQKYQLKQKMAEFATDQSVTSKGGAIVELINEKVSVVDSKVEGIKSNFWAIASAGLAFFLAMPAIIIPVAWIEIDKLQEERDAISDAQKRQTELLAAMKQEREQTEALIINLKNEMKRGPRRLTSPELKAPHSSLQQTSAQNTSVVEACTNALHQPKPEQLCTSPVSDITLRTTTKADQ